MKIEAGKRLRQARKRAGFKTRAEGVDALAVVFDPEKYTYSAVGNYGNGIRSFSAPEAKDFAAVYHCSASWLLCLDDENPLSPDERALIDNYRSTDDRGKRTISRIAEQESPYLVGDKKETA